MTILLFMWLYIIMLEVGNDNTDFANQYSHRRTELLTKNILIVVNGIILKTQKKSTAEGRTVISADLIPAG